MDSGDSTSSPRGRMMPVMAILQYELSSLASSWLVRLWLIASALLTLLTLSSGWAQLPTSVLMATLLVPYLVFPWFLVIMMLGISPVTGNRLDALVDGILCRPITRYEYLLASWGARVLLVLAVFLMVILPVALLLGTAQRPAADDSTWYGMFASLLVVSVVLTLMVSLGFLMGTLLRRPMVAAVILFFLWFPISWLLHTFSLEEFSPVSLDQALPTVLRTAAPWGVAEAEKNPTEEEQLAAQAQEAARALRAWTIGPARETNADGNPEFYRQGDYDDFSLLRVLLGYGLPALAAVGLSLVAFGWRDL